MYSQELYDLYDKEYTHIAWNKFLEMVMETGRSYLNGEIALPEEPSVDEPETDQEDLDSRLLSLLEKFSTLKDKFEEEQPDELSLVKEHLKVLSSCPEIKAKLNDIETYDDLYQEMEKLDAFLFKFT